MNKGKQLSINLIAQVVAFFVNFGINFFLTPFVLDNVGREAYGFVSLGNNFVNYASLLSLALNSMAGRFVTLKIHQDDFKSANQYYTSVIVTDCFLAIGLSVPAFIIVSNLKNIVSVPLNILTDVQWLWIFLFASFLIDIIMATFAVPLFSANRLDIQSKRNILAYLIKSGILLILYYLFPAKIWYIGFANIVCTIYTAIANIISGRKLYPELGVKIEYFNFSKLKDVFASGIWNSISRVGSIALTELDLLLSNLFIGANAMGTLSIAKTVPTYVSSFISSIICVFLPGLTISYAQGDREKLVYEIKSYIRLLIYFQTIIYGGLFIYLNTFLKLWLPVETKDINYIYLLAILTILDCIVSPIANIMFNVFTVTNKIKFSSITVIVTGLMSVTITYLLLKFTDFGLIAIAGVSVLLCNIRNICILIPYGAKCINMPWYTFFNELGLNVISLICSILICLVIRIFTYFNDNWVNLIFSIVISAISVACINFFLILKNEERNYVKSRIKRLLQK